MTIPLKLLRQPAVGLRVPVSRIHNVEDLEDDACAADQEPTGRQDG